MMPRLISTLLSLIVIIPYISAQKAPVKWGGVSKDELKMTSYALDTEADAVVLYDYGKVTYDVNAVDRPLVTERIVRVKLLTQAGVERYGDVTIPYYSYKKESVLSGVKGRVFLPGGDKINVSKSNIFKEERNKYWSQQKIAFPGLQPGSVVEYRYTLSSSRLFTPVDWFFQREIPVAHGELRVEFPEWYDYATLSQHMDRVVANKSSLSRSITYSSIDRGATALDKGSSSTGSIDVYFNKWNYIATDIPALKEEKFITTMENYYARVRFQLQSVQYPGQVRRMVSETWSKVAEEIMDDYSFGKMYTNQRHGNKILEEAGVDPNSMGDVEMATRLYQYVGSHMDWNETYNVYANGSAQELLKSGSGGSGDMNLVLLCGLRAAGIDASPVLISMRSEGKMFELYPFLDQFNHTLITATLDNKTVFIDATNGYRPLGLPMLNSLNYQGWKVGAHEHGWVKVGVPMSKSTYYAKLGMNESGLISGTLQTGMSGYHAVQHRGYYKRNKEAYLNNYMSCGEEKLSVTVNKVTNENDPYKKFNTMSEVSIEGINQGDFLYLTPPIRSGILNNPFKQASRSYPVEFPYPEEEKFIMDFTVPEGYSIESIPESLKMTSEDGGLSFERAASESPGKVQVRIKLTLRNLRYDPANYAMLRNFYNEVIKRLGEQVVLRKTT